MYRQPVLWGTLALSALACASGCVAYTADEADPSTVATEVGQRQGGTFVYEEATAAAFRQNPELRALAARARAAGADLAPFFLQNEYRSGRDMLGVMIDPIALLDLGPRGAANDTLDAEATAAAVALVTRRWQVAAEIAEVFAIEAVLVTLTVPEITVDPDAYERAGLASAVDAARVRAARAGAAAEREVLRAERERNLARFRRLLGLQARKEVAILPTMFAHGPVRTDEAILARPDLTLAAARFRVADARFRQAVADQYPSLMIGPEFPLNGSPIEWMAVLRLPIAAWGNAKAARAEREAARAELEAAFLDASRQVHEAELSVAELRANARAARESLAASEGMLKSALVAIEVDADAFARVAEAASMTIRDTKELRMAELARRLALHDLDVAYGWPAVVRPHPDADQAPQGGEQP